MKNSESYGLEELRRICYAYSNVQVAMTQLNNRHEQDRLMHMTCSDFEIRRLVDNARAMIESYEKEVPVDAREILGRLTEEKKIISESQRIADLRF